MDYYIKPAPAADGEEQAAPAAKEVKEPDFLRITKPERDQASAIRPAGSGHMLTYAFDLLYAIYEEEGDMIATEIPALILTHNL